MTVLAIIAALLVGGLIGFRFGVYVSARVIKDGFDDGHIHVAVTPTSLKEAA